MMKLLGPAIFLLAMMLAGCTNDKNAVKTPVPPPPPRTN
jgi:hypothetical protein